MSSNLVVAYDSNKQTWFGIDIPYPDGINIASITSNILNNTNYLCISGKFEFSTYTATYFSIALYNLDTSSWAPFDIQLDSSSRVMGALLNNTGSLYMTGNIRVDISPFAYYEYGVASTNIFHQPPSVSGVGNLTETSSQLAFYTNSNYQETIFAAGSYVIGNDLIAWEYCLLDGNRNWTVAGKGNDLYGTYTGGTDIIYLTGGKGLNGINE